MFSPAEYLSKQSVEVNDDGFANFPLGKFLIVDFRNISDTKSTKPKSPPSFGLPIEQQNYLRKIVNFFFLIMGFLRALFLRNLM